MVSHRCKMIVQQELDRIGIAYLSVDLGSVEMETNITNQKMEELRQSLQLVGLEFLENKKGVLIEKIKNVIIDLVQSKEEIPKLKYSDYLSKKLNYDYIYLSNVFSEVEGITIKQFIVLHKIEKIKEMLLYDELSLTEISHRMNYSSVSHLSTQFKKVTGLSPSYFNRMKQTRNEIQKDE